MHYLFSQIIKAFPAWNRREITEDDCWNYLRRHSVDIIEYPFAAKGYYGKRKFRGKYKYFIVLNTKLHGIDRLQTFLHEIGHHILHEPFGCREVLYFRRESSTESRQDVQADIFMAVAIIPKKLLFELKDTPFEEIPAEFAELCRLRLRIYEVYKI